MLLVRIKEIHSVLRAKFAALEFVSELKSLEVDSILSSKFTPW